MDFFIRKEADFIAWLHKNFLCLEVNRLLVFSMAKIIFHCLSYEGRIGRLGRISSVVNISSKCKSLGRNPREDIKGNIGGFGCLDLRYGKYHCNRSRIIVFKGESYSV